VKLLIVDHDQAQRKFLKDHLEEQDFEILMERDGNEVMKYLEEGPPELIISNFSTPNGGIELINNILKIEKELFPYVIFITEEHGEKHAIDSLGPIPGDFLYEPLKTDQLNARVSIAERAIALQKRLRDSKDIQMDLAMYDDLTNVLNRQAVYERALGELNRAKREHLQLCLAMMDMVNFEWIKSTYDLETANQAIQYVARAIRANVRMYDLVGRWITAKFFVLLPGLLQEHAQPVISRLYNAVTSVRVKHVDGDSIPIDLAVGYTWADGHEPDPLYVLIEKANEALLKATKMRGKNHKIKGSEKE
jgi:diguanylate cyclase (GGDEF)-like protein